MNQNNETPDHQSVIALWNLQVPGYLLHPEIRWISDPVEFEGDLSGFYATGILAELTSVGAQFSDFYGFEVACKLRTKQKLLAPIIMLSFLPEESFKDEIRYNILKARGTAFLQLPFGPEELLMAAQNTRSLSPAALADIISLLLNPRHLIDRFTHDIRFEMSQELITDRVGKIGADLPEELMNQITWDELIQPLIIPKVSEEQFYLRKKEVIAKLNSLMAPDYERSSSLIRYKVLLLEDNPEDSRIILEGLSPIYEVTHVKRGEEAVEIIDRDEINEYYALICDWRLLEPESDRQQANWQGYEVLEYAASKRFYALFSLTSLDDDSRKLISPYISCSFTPLTKDFEKGSSLWRVLLPIINHRIEENIAILAGLPTGDGWNRQNKPDYKKNSLGIKVSTIKSFPSFHQQYLQQRNHHSFVQWNNEISELCTRMWNYYKRSLVPDCDRSLQDISTKWGMELSRDVKSILVVRRIFLALWYNQSKIGMTIRVSVQGKYQVIENTVLNIYSILRNKYWNDTVGSGSDLVGEELYKKMISAAKAFTSQLALEPKSLPSGILPEEKGWLFASGIDIKKGNDVDYYENNED